ncbi:MAG TPA: hypothetical protein VL358_13765 [Caulobacteraceae bacterium]|nr:hypothetical protein [Caulobacteraceae bacterium]
MAEARILSRIVRLVVYCFWISIFIAVLWAFTISTLVPTKVGGQIAICGAAALGISAAIFMVVLRDFKPGSPRYEKAISMIPDLEKPLSRAVLVGSFTALISFFIIQGVVLYFWTSVFGVPGKMIAHINYYSNGARYECAGFNLQESAFLARRVVCISYRNGDAPARGTPVLLFGRLSPFGLIVSGFDMHVPVLPPLPR